MTEEIRELRRQLQELLEKVEALPFGAERLHRTMEYTDLRKKHVAAVSRETNKRTKRNYKL